MKLENLITSPKTKARKRVGRGIGSGLGKTSGRGHKGQKQDQVEELEEDLKVVKHHYIEDYQKEDLQIFTLKTIQK